MCDCKIIECDREIAAERERLAEADGRGAQAILWHIANLERYKQRLAERP